VAGCTAERREQPPVHPHPPALLLTVDVEASVLTSVPVRHRTTTPRLDRTAPNEDRRTASAPQAVAMPRTVAPPPIVPTSVAAPLVRLIVYSPDEAAPGAVSEAYAVPPGEMSKPRDRWC